VGYGVLMQAPPIIVANLLVLGAAGWASWRQPHRRPEVSASPARMVD
jgi:hypothetical protein